MTGFGEGRPPVLLEPRPALGHLRDCVQLAPSIQVLSILSGEGLDIATKILELMETHTDWSALNRALIREFEEEEEEMITTEKLFAPAPPSLVCRIGAWLVRTWEET